MTSSPKHSTWKMTISPSDLREKWWDDTRDAKGAALYLIMQKASNKIGWKKWAYVPLVERDNWCAWAEEYEQAVQ